MTKKTTKQSKTVPQPSKFLIGLAIIIIASMLAYSAYILVEVFVYLVPVRQAPLIVMLEVAQITAALLPITVGAVVYMGAQGSKLRKLVVASVYVGIYWVAKTLFAVFVPTFAIFSGIFGEEVYRDSGINFFLEYLVGSLVALIIYFATKKRTMKFTWPTTVFLIIAAVFLLLEAFGYFLR